MVTMNDSASSLVLAVRHTVGRRNFLKAVPVALANCAPALVQASESSGDPDQFSVVGLLGDAEDLLETIVSRHWAADIDALVAGLQFNYGDGKISIGDYINTRKEGHTYTVAAESATDYDLQTDEGLKLYEQFDSTPVWNPKQLSPSQMHEWVGGILMHGAGTYMVSNLCSEHGPQRGASAWLTALSGVRATQKRVLWSRTDRHVRVICMGNMSEGRYGGVIQHDKTSGYPNRKYSFVYTDGDPGDLTTWNEIDITSSISAAPDIFLYGDPVKGEGDNEYIYYGYGAARICYIRTTDNGMTWADGTAAPQVGGQAQPLEATVFKLSVGGYGMFVRPGGLSNGNTDVAQVSYSDDGLAWAKLVETNIEMAPANITAFEKGGRVHIFTTSREHTALDDVFDSIHHRSVDVRTFKALEGNLVYHDAKVIWRMPGRALGYIRRAVTNRGTEWITINGAEDYGPVTDPSFNAMWVISDEFTPVPPTEFNWVSNPLFISLDGGTTTGLESWEFSTSGGTMTAVGATVPWYHRIACPHRPSQSLDLNCTVGDFQSFSQTRSGDQRLSSRLSDTPLAMVIYGTGTPPAHLQARVGVKANSGASYVYSISGEFEFSPLATGIWSGVVDFPGPEIASGIDGGCETAIIVRNSGPSEAWEWECLGIALVAGISDGLLGSGFITNR